MSFSAGFYGEDAADRRQRLRTLLATLGESALRPKPSGKDGDAAGKEAGSGQAAGSRPTENTVWYHEGPACLRDARLWLAEYSMPRAKARLDKAREYYATVPEAPRKARVQEYHKALRVSCVEISGVLTWICV